MKSFKMVFISLFIIVSGLLLTYQFTLGQETPEVPPNPGGCNDYGYRLWEEDGTQGFESCSCYLIHTANPTQECP